MATSGLVISQDMLLAKPMVRHDMIRSEIFESDADSPWNIIPTAIAHSGTTAAINGSSALKLIPLFIRRAMMPRPVAKAIPKPIVGTTSVSPLVNGINEAPITWQMTEVATSAIMLGVNVLILSSPTGIY